MSDIIWFLLIALSPIWILLIIVITAIVLVYKSAKKLQRAGVNVWAPGNWAGVALLFFPIGEILYIIFYFTKYKPELRRIQQSSAQQ